MNFWGSLYDLLAVELDDPIYSFDRMRPFA